MQPTLRTRQLVMLHMHRVGMLIFGCKCMFIMRSRGGGRYRLIRSKDGSRGGRKATAGHRFVGGRRARHEATLRLLSGKAGKGLCSLGVREKADRGDDESVYESVFGRCSN
jgi:hypothetical protein